MFITATKLPLHCLTRAKPAVMKLMGYCPFPLQKAIIEPLLNQIFAEAINDDDLDFLRGRYLLVNISDLPLQLCLTYSENRLRIVDGMGDGDAKITGTTKSFVLLASRQEDPDTLFFRRQLSIEGDTDLGLATKNLMDSIELSNVPGPLRHALDKAGKIFAYS